jgi:Tfp pilus assembly protein PilV
MKTYVQGAHGAAGGFTLLETAIALLVMMIAGLSVASLFAFAHRYNQGANGRAVAQAIAQRQMENLRKTPFAEVDDSTQVVAVAGRSYQVITTVCSDGSAACGGNILTKRITVQVTPLNAGQGWSASSVTLVALRGDTATGAFY